MDDFETKGVIILLVGICIITIVLLSTAYSSFDSYGDWLQNLSPFMYLVFAVGIGIGFVPAFYFIIFIPLRLFGIKGTDEF